MNVKTLSLAFKKPPNVYGTLYSALHSVVLNRQALLQFLDPLVGFLQGLLSDLHTTFGHGNQRHLVTLSNPHGREWRLLQSLLNEIYHPCTYLGAGPLFLLGNSL